MRDLARLERLHVFACYVVAVMGEAAEEDTDVSGGHRPERLFYPDLPSALFEQPFDETRDRAWQAFVDGSRTNIYRTNGMLKGIIVPKGNHEIVFRYRPPYFLLTGIVSTTSLFLILCTASYLFLRKRKRI